MRAAGLEPLEPYPGTAVPWRCRHLTCGREITPRLGGIAGGSGPCRHCAGTAPLDPEQAAAVMRAAGLEPLEPYPGSSAPWRCRHLACGREVTPRHAHIRRGEGPCKWCAPNAPVDPARAATEMRAAGLEPLEPYPGVDTPWRSRCLTCGQATRPTLGCLRRGQGGCRPCGRRAAGAAIRLDAAQATAEMRAAGLEPLEPYPGTKVPWRCRCLTCQSEVQPCHGDVRDRGSGCRYCANRARGLAQRHDGDQAVADMRAAGLEPLEPYPGLKKPWRCRCTTCGRPTSPAYGGIRAGQGGCRHCADVNAGRARREDPGRAVADMRAAGLEPLEPYSTSMTPWRCRCLTCGHEVTPTLSKIRSGRRCRYCATHGFDPGAPARLYLVVHPVRYAVKLGVGATGNGHNDRVAQHRRTGWILLHEVRFCDGAAALAVEQAVLRFLRQRGHRPFLTRDQMPNGWSETFAAVLLPPATLWTVITEETWRQMPQPQPAAMLRPTGY